MPEDHASPAATPPLRRRRALLMTITLLLLLAGSAGWWWWQHAQAEAAKQQQGRGPRIVPVQIGTVSRGDIRVFFSSLGTVTASSSVVVRPRVDGYLTRLHFKEGDSVEAGQLLAEIDPRPFRIQLAQAEGQLARDQAQLANARKDLARYQSLLADDSIARQQVDNQQAQVRQLEGTVKADQASVDNARLQLDYARVSAPVGGRLGLRNVDVGSLVRSTDSAGLVTINTVTPINVVFTLPEAQVQPILDALRAGERIRVEAWDRERTKRLELGRVAAADNQIDTVTGTLRLKALFANKEGTLFPNQFVNVRVLAETRKDVTVLPSAAIQRGSNGAFVYAVREGVARMRKVKLGASEEDRTEILEGLVAGETVVTDGIDQLRDNTRVEVANPAELLRRKPRGSKRHPAEGGASAPASAAHGEPSASAPGSSAGHPPHDEASGPRADEHRHAPDGASAPAGEARRARRETGKD